MSSFSPSELQEFADIYASGISSQAHAFKAPINPEILESLDLCPRLLIYISFTLLAVLNVITGAGTFLVGGLQGNRLQGFGLRDEVGVSHNYGYLFGSSQNKDYSVLSSILGSPCFGKLPISIVGRLAGFKLSGRAGGIGWGA